MRGSFDFFVVLNLLEFVGRPWHRHEKIEGWPTVNYTVCSSRFLRACRPQRRPTRRYRVSVGREFS